MSDVEQVPLTDQTKFMRELVYHKSLTRIAHRVALKLTQGYRADWGYCCYSIDELTEYVGVSRRSIVNALKALEEHGFIHITRTKNRNHYVPLFYDKLKPSKRKIQNHTKVCESGTENKVNKYDQQAECKTVHSHRVQNNAPLSIEKKSPTDSLAESVSGSSYRTTKKPTARRASPPQRRARTIVPMVSSWTGFLEHILDHWRIPPDWDRWGLERSVQAFIRTMRRECPRWCGLELATARLRRWLVGERYKTRPAYVYRGIEEFEES